MDKKVDKTTLLGADYRLFQNTPAWGLAKAVWKEDLSKIKEEVKMNPKIIDFQEQKYSKSLLHLSITNDDYKSFKALLKLGANPNLYDSAHCTSPIILTSQQFDNKTKYAKLLIKYGADVNDIECAEGMEEQKTLRTPLISASSNGNIELVKLLVENGADVNKTNDNEEHPLDVAVLLDHYDVVLYLLEQGADCDKVLYQRGGDGDHLTDIYMRDVVNELAFIHSKESDKILDILKINKCL